MSRFLSKLLAIFFPWITLFILDNPGGALVALIMQTTIIGWLPASLWALRVLKENTATIEEDASKKSDSLNS